MIRVFIADDHTIVRAGLKRLLSETEDIEVAGEAGDGVEALAAVDAIPMDVLLLDLNMPNLGGMEVLKEVRKRRPNLGVLVLTMYPEDQYALRVFQSGGDGFICKSSVSDDLIQAIRRVAAGRKYVSPSAAERLVQHLGMPEAGRTHDVLSPRELQTLRGIGVGKTLSELAAELGVSVKTVSTFRHRLLIKLKLKNNIEIARYAVDHNLV
jgi:two-component system, NarL family, invasion response regulator UvrY